MELQSSQVSGSPSSGDVYLDAGVGQVTWHRTLPLASPARLAITIAIGTGMLRLGLWLSPSANSDPPELKVALKSKSAGRLCRSVDFCEHEAFPSLHLQPSQAH
jgi:hypothetical protein